MTQLPLNSSDIGVGCSCAGGDSVQSTGARRPHAGEGPRGVSRHDVLPCPSGQRLGSACPAVHPHAPAHAVVVRPLRPPAHCMQAGTWADVPARAVSAPSSWAHPARGIRDRIIPDDVLRPKLPAGRGCRYVSSLQPPCGTMWCGGENENADRAWLKMKHCSARDSELLSYLFIYLEVTTYHLTPE